MINSLLSVLCQKPIRVFQSAINVDSVFSLIKEVKLTFLPSSIFTNHFSIVDNSESFHLSAYNNFTAVLTYKNKMLDFLLYCLFISPEIQSPGLNYTLIFKILWISVCIWIQNFLTFTCLSNMIKCPFLFIFPRKKMKCSFSPLSYIFYLFFCFKFQ